MHLVNGRQLRSRQHSGDSPRPVLGDRVAVVAAAVADVEPGHVAGGTAAAPRKEAVRHSGQARRPDHLDPARGASRMMMSSAAWLPTMTAYVPTAANP